MDRSRLTWCRALFIASTGVMLFANSGCSSHPNSSNGSQVVAKVGSDEITEVQLTQRLYNHPNPTEQDRRRALDSLIDESLLVRAALKSELERDPGVIEALQSSRRRVLGEAYLETSVYGKSEVSPDEIKAYYDAHPALFEKHRTVTFSLFTIDGKDLNQSLEQQLGSSQTPQKLADLLGRSHISYAQAIATIASEQMPIEKLSTFSQVGIGDVLVLDRGQPKSRLLVADDIREDSRSLSASEQQIKLYLTNLKKEEAARSFLQQARATTTIEYHSDTDRQVTITAPTTVPVRASATQDTGNRPANINDTIASGIR